LAVHTSSNRVSGLPRARNPRARASLVVGVLAVAAVPAGVAAARAFEEITLVQSALSAVLAALLGMSAIVLARRGRELLERTLGRSGGELSARVGGALGVVALWLACAVALAVAFYGLLALLAD
jgi:hypothetical protein